MEMIYILLSLLIGGLIGLFISKKISGLQAEKDLAAGDEKFNLLLKEKEYQQNNAKENIARLEQSLLESKNEQEKLIVNGKIDLEELRYQKEEQLSELAKEKELLAVSLERADAKTEELTIDLRENKAEIEKLQEKFTKEFENLANKILEEKSKTFSDQNQKNINDILKPLQEKIQSFEKKVEDTNKESIDRNSGLRQQIESLKDLNNKMSAEAVNLTKALKGDNKVQGDWGETQLEVILETAKLTKEIHYTPQGGHRDDSGKLKKPDFIINLPDDRQLIIDSKVSLTNYEAYYSADDDTNREIYLNKHIDSIKKHIKELSEKKYADLYEINTPDYVIMFVPIEPALMLALTKNNNLYLDALDKNIVLVSISTLLATLSTVSSMWRQENQKKNILEIASQASKLYDQFVNLTDDLLKVGNQLKTVQGSYDSSMRKLTGKGNLIRKVENIKDLGVITNKNFNQNLIDRASEEA